MDRPRIRIVAACGLALLLGASGCRQTPTRRVPPEPPYGGGAAPAPYGDPGVGFSQGSAGMGLPGATGDPYAQGASPYAGHGPGPGTPGAAAGFGAGPAYDDPAGPGAPPLGGLDAYAPGPASAPAPGPASAPGLGYPGAGL